MKKIFSVYCWFYLFLNLLVILGGALVRATNSGAGCGEYWPLCQGSVLPELKTLDTIIEFTHRVSSGVVGVGALLLVLGAFVLYPKKHIVRRASLTVLFFVFLEALLGAALVLFGLVENNTSLARIVMMSLHLINTFLLVASITLTAGFVSNLFNKFALCNIQLIKTVHKKQFLMSSLCLLLLLLTGVTGALTALSDTVFKPTEFAHNLYQDFFAPSHILNMLKMFHPVIALVTSGIIAFFVFTNTRFVNFASADNANVNFNAHFKDSKTIVISAAFILFIISTQIAVGLFNMLFFTPIVLQLVHLFLADILWILCLLYFNKKLNIAA